MLLLLFLLYVVLAVQALPLPSPSIFDRRGGTKVCNVTLRRKHRDVCRSNNNAEKSYWFREDELVSGRIENVLPTDQCDHTFEIQLFKRFFRDGAAKVHRTERQLCDQLFPTVAVGGRDRKQELQAIMESENNLFFIPGSVNRAKAIMVADNRNFRTSTPDVLKNRRAAAKVLRDHKAEMLGTIDQLAQLLRDTPAEAEAYAASVASQGLPPNPFDAGFTGNWRREWDQKIEGIITKNEKLFDPSEVEPVTSAAAEPSGSKACPKGYKRQRSGSDSTSGRVLRPNYGYNAPKARAEKEEEDSCVPDDAAATQNGANSGLSSSRTATASVTSTGLASSVTGSRPSSLSLSGDALLPKPTAQATASGTYRNGAATRSGEQLGSKAQTQSLAVHSIAASSPTSRLSAQSAAGQPLASEQSSKPTAVQAAPALSGKPTRMAAAPAHIKPAAAAPLSRPNTPSTAKRPAFRNPFSKAKTAPR